MGGPLSLAFLPCCLIVSYFLSICSTAPLCVLLSHALNRSSFSPHLPSSFPLLFFVFFSPSRVCCFDRLPPASGTKALYLGPTNIHVFYWGARRRGRTTSKSLGFILGGPIGYSAAELGVQESQTVAARFSGSCASFRGHRQRLSTSAILSLLLVFSGVVINTRSAFTPRRCWRQRRQNVSGNCVVISKNASHTVLH